MTSLTLNQFLLLYVWFVLAALLFFLLLIARHYQKFSGERTYFQGFVLPIGLFAAAAARYSSLDRVAGDHLGDLLSALAGITVIVLGLYLYKTMTVGRE